MSQQQLISATTSLFQKMQFHPTEDEKELKAGQFLEGQHAIRKYCQQNFIRPNLLKNFEMFNNMVGKEVTSGENADRFKDWKVKVTLTEPGYLRKGNGQQVLSRTYTLLLYSPKFFADVTTQPDPVAFLEAHPEYNDEYRQYFCGLIVNIFDKVTGIIWNEDSKGKRTFFKTH